jgi:hypothetical protein
MEEVLKTKTSQNVSLHPLVKYPIPGSPYPASITRWIRDSKNSNK